MVALVDCNNFFASCERLFRPDLIDKPIAVLSSNDGCIVARSNEVKKMAVPMGIPYFKVRDILTRNNVSLFSSNFSLYSNISQRVVEQLKEFSPEIEIYSVDEAFLELKNLPIRDYESWARKVKNEVDQNIGVPVSVGVAPTKTLAKLASDFAKSHKFTCVIDPKNKTSYKSTLQAVPVDHIWGVGRQYAKRLQAAGVHAAWDLRSLSKEWLHSQMGINGSRLHDELNGIVRHKFEDEKKPQKSVIASRSFGHKVRSHHELEVAVASFAAKAAARLRRFDQTTRLFGVFLYYQDQEGSKQPQSAAIELLPASNDTCELTEVALALTKKLYLEDVGYKKAGVFAYQLSPVGATQQALLDDKSPDQRLKQKQLMESVDEINARFGSSTVQLASVDTKPTRWLASQALISPAYTTSWNDLPKVHA